jgi:hypothetical protein
MEQCIRPCWTQIDYSAVNELFETGWVLNPNINNGKPIRLEGAVVYHLVFYHSEDLEAMKQNNNGKPQIVELHSVPIGEVNTWLVKGFEVEQTFAKNVTVVKREVVKNGD